MANLINPALMVDQYAVLRREQTQINASAVVIAAPDPQRIYMRVIATAFTHWWDLVPRPSGVTNGFAQSSNYPQGMEITYAQHGPLVQQGWWANQQANDIAFLVVTVRYVPTGNR